MVHIKQFDDLSIMEQKQLGHIKPWFLLWGKSKKNLRGLEIGQKLSYSEAIVHFVLGNADFPVSDVNITRRYIISYWLVGKTYP